jgi:hypothetical protein
MQLYGMLKPPAMAGRSPQRVHMELAAPAGAVARRNLPAGVSAAAPAPATTDGDAAVVLDY